MNIISGHIPPCISPQRQMPPTQPQTTSFGQISQAMKEEPSFKGISQDPGAAGVRQAASKAAPGWIRASYAARANTDKQAPSKEWVSGCVAKVRDGGHQAQTGYGEISEAAQKQVGHPRALLTPHRASWGGSPHTSASSFSSDVINAHLASNLQEILKGVLSQEPSSVQLQRIEEGIPGGMDRCCVRDLRVRDGQAPYSGPTTESFEERLNNKLEALRNKIGQLKTQEGAHAAKLDAALAHIEILHTEAVGKLYGQAAVDPKIMARHDKRAKVHLQEQAGKSQRVIADFLDGAIDVLKSIVPKGDQFTKKDLQKLEKRLNGERWDYNSVNLYSAEGRTFVSAAIPLLRATEMKVSGDRTTGNPSNFTMRVHGEVLDDGSVKILGTTVTFSVPTTIGEKDTIKRDKKTREKVQGILEGLARFQYAALSEDQRGGKLHVPLSMESLLSTFKGIDKLRGAESEGMQLKEYARAFEMVESHSMVIDGRVIEVVPDLELSNHGVNAQALDKGGAFFQIDPRIQDPLNAVAFIKMAKDVQNRLNLTGLKQEMFADPPEVSGLRAEAKALDQQLQQLQDKEELSEAESKLYKKTRSQLDTKLLEIREVRAGKLPDIKNAWEANKGEWEAYANGMEDGDNKELLCAFLEYQDLMFSEGEEGYRKYQEVKYNHRIQYLGNRITQLRGRLGGFNCKSSEDRTGRMVNNREERNIEAEKDPQSRYHTRARDVYASPVNQRLARTVNGNSVSAVITNIQDPGAFGLQITSKASPELRTATEGDLALEHKTMAMTAKGDYKFYSLGVVEALKDPTGGVRKMWRIGKRWNRRDLQPMMKKAIGEGIFEYQRIARSIASLQNLERSY
ncbi:MAG: hypothetical protein KDK78_02530 [Chlamydiia bacterium]|nr:hypothetical protein [Chlamydiia bacterium]